MDGNDDRAGKAGGSPALHELLASLARGAISIGEAERAIRGEMLREIENLASIDLFRELRAGVPEIIFAESKTTEQLARIVDGFVAGKGSAVISRLTAEQLGWLRSAHPGARINEQARMAAVGGLPTTPGDGAGVVGVITAGTSDIPVAEEAAFVCEVMGCKVERVYDIGIAGIHRVFKPLQRMIDAGVDAIVCCAGMEGALPSIVASLTDVLVIGVPVSTGYGFGGQGETAIRSMLQSCSPGLVVVNINNGTGAGASAALVARRCARARATTRPR